MGDGVDALRRRVDLTKCGTEGGKLDCEVSDIEGVRHLLFGDSVTRSQARASDAPTAQLPFGLRFRDSVAAALGKLPLESPSLWTVGKDADGKVTLVSLANYRGERGEPFGITLVFDRTGLEMIEYRVDW